MVWCRGASLAVNCAPPLLTAWPGAFTGSVSRCCKIGSHKSKGDDFENKITRRREFERIVSENCFKGFGNQVLRNFEDESYNQNQQGYGLAFVRFWQEGCKTSFLEM